MRNATTFVTQLWLALLTLTCAIAQNPSEGGSRKGKKPGTAKLGPIPVVYEVSKSGKDQKKLLKIYAAVRESTGDTLTKEEFVRRLKAREHFEINFPEQCRTCSGWRRLIPKGGKRGADGKVPCRDCQARGYVMYPYVVKWSSSVITHLGDQRDPVLASLLRELGDHASANTWFEMAVNYHTGKRSTEPSARELAHAAYEQAVAKANSGWRRDEPASSDYNRLQRKIIDEGLRGIAATTPRREEKPQGSPATPAPPPR